MQWQFRKVLQNFETYKKAIDYKTEIQKGDTNILKMTIRQVQLILSQPNDKIKSKVLAMRFVRDIMILGRQDVILNVQRLIPYILKICSFQMQNDDPNRGEAFFYQHPSYLKTSKEDQKNEIQQLGSTFLILSLQSIIHWAKWIPVDSQGKISIYAKAYDDLIERGVNFPSAFNYYKQSDTEKFKNTYRVEFFPDSYYSSAGDQTNSSAAQSHLIQNQSSLMKKPQAEHFQNSVESELFEKTQITTLDQIREYIDKLNQSKQSSNSINRRLQTINKRLQQIYDEQFAQNKTSKNKNLKALKSWTDKYFINYGFYYNKKIDMKQFIKRVNTQQIFIDHQQISSSSLITNQQKIQNSNVRMLKSPKKQVLLAKTIPSSQQLLKKQQHDYKAHILTLKSQNQSKNEQIKRLNQLYEQQKKQLISDYEKRMQTLKNHQATRNQKNKPLLLQLQYQNQQLKRRINHLQDQILSKNSNLKSKNQNQQIENQSNLQDKRKTDNQLTKLKLQNEKLIQIISQKNEKQYKAKIQQDDGSNYNSRFKQQQSKKLNYINPANVTQLQNVIIQKDEKAKKLQKTIKKLEDQLELFKTQLMIQRSKKDQKSDVLNKKIQYFQMQNKNLKQKFNQSKRLLDLKDVQIIDLKEQLKRFHNKFKDISQKRSLYSQTPISLKSNTKFGAQFDQTEKPTSPRDPYKELLKNRQIRYNNYQDLYLQLKPANKQGFLRLCRSSFKKKDILFKENELEIGVISQSITDSKVGFLLHLTNLSQKIIQNVRLQPMLNESMITTLTYDINMKYVSSIQPQQQQKINFFVINSASPFIKDRAIICISYQKKGLQYKHNIFLPFMIPKFLITSKPSSKPLSPKFVCQQIEFKYTKKMLPRPNYIKNYFQQIFEKVEDKMFQVQFVHRQTDLNMFASFSFQSDTLKTSLIALRQRLNQRQRYVFQQLFAFLEVSFRK